MYFSTDNSSIVIQPLIQRILRSMCTFKRIREIFIELQTVQQLRTLLDAQSDRVSQSRAKPMRASSLSSSLGRLIQILES